ncbi:MAG: hypothetical protein QM569_14830 [Acidovorax sp.]|uniref:hypothetical protein n=1 Tax=Acidovorax sp. TaxID=1872122 RepID=UPI0039E32B19
MAARLLSALLLALALVAGGYWWGRTATDNAWAARQAKAADKARIELDQANERADQAAANYLTEHLDQEDRYAVLESKYCELGRRVPLVVYRPVPAVAACGSEARPAVERAANGDPGAGGPALTLAAVRMWNGALTATDAPAGACGLAGAPEGADAACAEDSGLTLQDAWDNHAANAKSCAQDRQRYRALIDHLKQPEGEGAPWPSKKTN